MHFSIVTTHYKKSYYKYIFLSRNRTAEKAFLPTALPGCKPYYSLLRMILPLMVFGRSLRNTTIRGYL